VTNCNGGSDKTFWTKKGVITLGFKQARLLLEKLRD